jgi:hypothetical protein
VRSSVPAIVSTSKLPGVIRRGAPPARGTVYTLFQPSRSLVQVNRAPPSIQAGRSTTSTQVESRSVRIVRTAPVRASATTSSRVFCSRLSRCTSSSAFDAAHCIRAR